MDYIRLEHGSVIDADKKIAKNLVKDTVDNIINSEVIVIETKETCNDTFIQLGQIHGMKTLAKMILSLSNELLYELPYNVLNEITELAKRVANIDVIPYSRDEDKMSQYTHGICLDLTNDKGFYDLESVSKKVEELKAQYS